MITNKSFQHCTIWLDVHNVWAWPGGSCCSLFDNCANSKTHFAEPTSIRIDSPVTLFTMNCTVVKYELKGKGAQWMSLSTHPSHGITGRLSRGIPPRHSMQLVTNQPCLLRAMLQYKRIPRLHSRAVIALHRITRMDELDSASGRLSKSQKN